MSSLPVERGSSFSSAGTHGLSSPSESSRELMETDRARVSLASVSRHLEKSAGTGRLAVPEASSVVPSLQRNSRRSSSPPARAAWNATVCSFIRTRSPWVSKPAGQSYFTLPMPVMGGAASRVQVAWVSARSPRCLPVFNSPPPLHLPLRLAMPLGFTRTTDSQRSMRVLVNSSSPASA